MQVPNNIPCPSHPELSLTLLCLNESCNTVICEDCLHEYHSGHIIKRLMRFCEEERRKYQQQPQNLSEIKDTLYNSMESLSKLQDKTLLDKSLMDNYSVEISLKTDSCQQLITQWLDDIQNQNFQVDVMNVQQLQQLVSQLLNKNQGSNFNEKLCDSFNKDLQKFIRHFLEESKRLQDELYEFRFQFLNKLQGLIDKTQSTQLANSNSEKKIQKLEIKKISVFRDQASQFGDNLPKLKSPEPMRYSGEKNFDQQFDESKSNKKVRVSPEQNQNPICIDVESAQDQIQANIDRGHSFWDQFQNLKPKESVQPIKSEIVLDFKKAFNKKLTDQLGGIFLIDDQLFTILDGQNVYIFTYSTNANTQPCLKKILKCTRLVKAVFYKKQSQELVVFQEDGTLDIYNSKEDYKKVLDKNIAKNPNLLIALKKDEQGYWATLDRKIYEISLESEKKYLKYMVDEEQVGKYQNICVGQNHLILTSSNIIIGLDYESKRVFSNKNIVESGENITAVSYNEKDTYLIGTQKGNVYRVQVLDFNFELIFKQEIQIPIHRLKCCTIKNSNLLFLSVQPLNSRLSDNKHVQIWQIYDNSIKFISSISDINTSADISIVLSENKAIIGIGQYNGIVEVIYYDMTKSLVNSAIQSEQKL